MIFTATVAKLACIRSDDALLVSQDGIVDHAGDGAHGRPEGGVVLQALHRDSPELQVTARSTWLGSGAMPMARKPYYYWKKSFRV